jgi:hypothetical protein
MVRTRFPPDRIIDWVDQAILFTHLGPDQEGEENQEGEKKGKKQDGGKKSGSRKERLRLSGIRTATSLIKAFEAAQKKRDDAKEVDKILTDALGSPIQLFLDGIETEPNLALIRAWRDMPAKGGSPAELTQSAPASKP